MSSGASAELEVEAAISFDSSAKQLFHFNSFFILLQLVATCAYFKSI